MSLWEVSRKLFLSTAPSSHAMGGSARRRHDRIQFYSFINPENTTHTNHVKEKLQSQELRISK